MPKKGPLDMIAERVSAEMETDVKALTAKLSAELASAGASKLTREKYLEVWHRNWPDAGFRAAVLKQVGPHHFLQTARDMVARHGHPILTGGGPNVALGNVGNPVAGAAGGPGGGPGFGPPAAPVKGIPEPPYEPPPPTGWGQGG